MNKIKIEQMSDFEKVQEVLLLHAGTSGTYVKDQGTDEVVYYFQGHRIKIGDTFTWEDNEHGGHTFGLIPG